jgi:hypothetical protein
MCDDRRALHRRGQLLVWKLLDLRARQHATVEQADFATDSLRRRMITRQHHQPDAGLAVVMNGLGSFRTNGVLDAEEAERDELVGILK